MSTLLLKLYSLLMEPVVWGVLFPWHMWHLLRGRIEPAAVRQRLGCTALLPSPSTRRLVVHAVSVGELAAAEPVIRRLCAADPQLSVLITSGNTAGLAAARALQERMEQVSGVAMLPWDRRDAVRRWLQAAAPLAVVVVETEIWPNLFLECRSQGIPLALVNGRIYPRDLFGYRLLHPIMKKILDCATLIGVQDERERRRFLAIGAPADRLTVLGNSKYDREPAEHRAVPPGYRSGRLLLVAGSTHAPEERRLLHACVSLRAEFPTLDLVLAPRDPGRGPAVARLAEKQGLRSRLASQGPSDHPDWDVMVLDSIGGLIDWYAVADLVVIGGSLANHGGHNPLEPAALERPILVGPHMQHFAEMTERLAACRALCRLQRPDHLLPALVRLLSRPSLRRRMGSRAGRCAAAGRGAAQRYAQALSELWQ